MLCKVSQFSVDGSDSPTLGIECRKHVHELSGQVIAKHSVNVLKMSCFYIFGPLTESMCIYFAEYIYFFPHPTRDIPQIRFVLLSKASCDRSAKLARRSPCHM